MLIKFAHYVFYSQLVLLFIVRTARWFCLPRRFSWFCCCGCAIYWWLYWPRSRLSRFRVSRCVKHVVIWNGGIRYELASVYVCSLKKKKGSVQNHGGRSAGWLVLVSGWLKELWACACWIVCSNCLNYYYKEYICETIVCPKKKGYRESAAICNNVTTIFTFSFLI